MGCGSSTELPVSRTRSITRNPSAANEDARRVLMALRIKDTEPELEPIDMLLLRAALNGDLAGVETIVENNALTNELSDALICAAHGGHLEVVKYLCDHGAKTGLVGERDTTALLTAAEHGHVRVVRYLVEDWEAGLDTRCSDGLTALHYAAATDQADVVKLLLALGAPIDDRIGPSQNFAILGMTPLHIAASAGSLRAFRILLERGADVHAVAASGVGVVKFALDGGSREMKSVIDHLLQKGTVSK